MSAHKTRLIRIWEIWTARLDKELRPKVSSDKLLELMGRIFCPGPFYFFLFDLTRFEMNHVHDGIEQVLGYSAEGMNFGEWMKLVHPADVPFMQACEKKIGEVLFDKIAPAEIPHYKMAYCIRVRNQQGAYRTILHQGVTYGQDASGMVHASLIVHTDITHLIQQPARTVSMLHLGGGTSFLAMPVEVASYEHPADLPLLLSPRELEILGLLAEGNTDKEIAELLFVSPHTVRTHRRNLREKLASQNTTGMVAKAIREGII